MVFWDHPFPKSYPISFGNTMIYRHYHISFLHQISGFPTPVFDFLPMRSTLGLNSAFDLNPHQSSDLMIL